MIIASDFMRRVFKLCLDMWGCFGGITFRHIGKRGVVVYYERKRTGALSPAQQEHQTQFKRGYEQWRSLTPDQQDQWRLAADRSSSRMIGSHLFLRVWWHQDLWTVQQLERHFNVTLELPEP